MKSSAKALEFVIRYGGSHDAAAIAHLGGRVFYETFAAMTPADDMKHFLAATYTPYQIAQDLADPRSAFFMAFAGGELAGFCQLRNAEVDPCVHVPAPIELQRLYVDANWHGGGVAPALLRAAVGWAQSGGFVSLWLGVSETNFRAQRFYKKFGLQACGSHNFLVGTDRQTDLIMEGSLQVAAEAEAQMASGAGWGGRAVTRQ